MNKLVRDIEIGRVACALSDRIVDEWQSDLGNDTKETLRQSLYSMFLKNPEECETLWNNGIIEEDYFDDLD